MSTSASRLPPLFLAALLLSCALPAAQLGPPPPGSPPANGTTEVTFRAESNLALVRFQVIGKKNDFVADLRADEIELREDGVPQKIALFEGGKLNPRASNIDIHLLFDCSGSVQQAGLLNPHAFSANLLEEFQNVRIAIWGFSGRSLGYFTAPTRDPGRLTGAMESVREMKPDSTPLYRSLAEVIGRLASAAGNAVPMVVVISDGQDEGKDADAVRAAQSAGIPVFPALVNSELDWLGRGSYSYLTDNAQRQITEQSRFAALADSTGGHAFKFAGKIPENLLDQILKQMAEEIRYNYTVGYYPTSGGKSGSRKVQVVLKDSIRGRIVGGSRNVDH